MQIDQLRGKSVDQLFEAILSLKTKEECYLLFEDLATTNEIILLSQRLEVAKLLTEGYTYNKIEEKTDASTVTISRVRKSIDKGINGYRMVLDRIR